MAIYPAQFPFSIFFNKAARTIAATMKIIPKTPKTDSTSVQSLNNSRQVLSLLIFALPLSTKRFKLESKKRGKFVAGVAILPPK
jgi:hypothetical protein